MTLSELVNISSFDLAETNPRPLQTFNMENFAIMVHSF